MKGSTQTVFILLCVILPFVFCQTCSSTPVPYCDDWLCGADISGIFANNTACKQCTKDDFATRFTECENNKKSLFYYWKPPATCLASPQVSSLPSSIQNIDCGVSCTAGQSFNISSKVCQDCASGSFASNGNLIFNEWHSLPSKFSTRCEVDNPALLCRPWRALGDYIESGQNQFLVGLRSILDLKATLSTEGSITFEYWYRTDDASERLFFVINNNIQIPLTNTSNAWSTFTIALQPGSYTFTWRIKRSYLLYGTNTARLRIVSINGLSNVDTECKQCPVGSYSDGRSPCRLCPRGKYAPSAGMSSCLTCPPDHTSLVGQGSCFLLPFLVCNTSDIYYKYSACTGSTRQRIADWIYPRLCNPALNGSVQLPPPTTVPCVTSCPYPNQVLVNNECTYCPPGSRVVNGQCQQCPTNQGTQNSITISEFYNETMLSLGLGTGCFGECKSRGWRYAGNYIDTGIGNGVATTFLRIPVNNMRGVNASLSLTYTLSCPDHGGELLVATFALTPLKVITCGGCSNKVVTETVEIPETDVAFSRFIFLVYRSFTPETDHYDCDRAVIHSLSIKNAGLGGSTICMPCASGTSAFGNCAPCRAGTHSLATEFNCTQCPENTFSISESASCVPCPTGMNSTVGSGVCSWTNGQCILDTTVAGLTKKFNWQGVSAAVDNKAYFAPTVPESRFYFNLAVNPRSFICGSSIVCELHNDGSLHSAGDYGNVTGFADTTSMGIRMELSSIRNNCNGKPSRTIVSLLCDVNVPSNNPRVVLAEDAKDNCILYANITSSAVCPQCIEDDYFFYRGTCIDGKRDTRWSKRPGPAHLCINGVTKDLNLTTVDCTREIVVEFPVWAVFVGIGGAGLVVLFVIGLIGLVGFLYYRYRTLNTKFQQLEEQETAQNNSL